MDKSRLMEEEGITTFSTGTKFDDGKLRMGLIPPIAVEELAKVLTYGAQKYSESNWKIVEEYRYKDALLRHIFAWMDGEEFDQESGIHHLSHAMCNVAFLIYKNREVIRGNKDQT